MPIQGFQWGNQSDSSLGGFQLETGPTEMGRHVREVHIQPKAYLCPLVGICPRSIIGNGFGRMHQLIDHLKSGVHNMTPGQARMEAHRHNFNRKHNTGVEVEVNVISSNNNNNINGAAADDDQY
ncbi:uncharacterized protein PV06_10779 [Exophiala oligosperma]|uniref:C2H2-domain containing protein second zinc finger domain-containing protein n=1 Tax=Exophiala oligosperma TaxID=215243 RepID=A0A0D2D4A3_9EURO|nr:uncharacterized protein PV06_10779 [Exophiala oligosperma]KIW37160.1 hypothetical protein PV06_10779 [Exophiala oligosperma]